MKSSVKRTYDRTVSPDGAVTLEYKGSRLNAHQVAGSGVFGVALLVGGLYWTAYLANSFESSFGMFGVIIAVIIGLASTIYVFKILLGRRKYQIILTNEGIIFPRASYGSWTGQLAFSDIDQLGVSSHSSTGTKGFYSSANVYAASGGTEVNISRFIDQALADALIKEINLKITEFYQLTNTR